MSKIYVAVTGGIGSGKSLVLECLRKLHYAVFSCDELYKNIIVSKEYIERIENIFPGVVQNGEINRKILSELVFDNPSNREKLNAIAHPMIMDLLMRKMKEANGNIVFAEVPLLFEGNYENLFHKVIYVRRDKTERIFAVQNRDGLQIEHIKKRIEAQFDCENKKGKQRLNACNAYVLDNNGTIQQLKERILEFLKDM